VVAKGVEADNKFVFADTFSIFWIVRSWRRACKKVFIFLVNFYGFIKPKKECYGSAKGKNNGAIIIICFQEPTSLFDCTCLYILIIHALEIHFHEELFI